MKIRRIIALAAILSLSLAGFGPAAVVEARQRAYRTNDAQMRRLLQRIETRADRFSTSLENALDRSRHNGTAREDEVNKLLTDFEQATDQLRDRFNNNTSTGMDVQFVLQRAALLDTFMRDNRLANRAERDWTLLRGDLDQLARNYSVAWNWNSPVVATPGAQAAYRLSDWQMRQLIQRVETRSDTFSRSFERALDLSRYNNTAREDELNKWVTDFEYATDQLRDRYNSRTSSATDAEMVLQRAALLDSFMRGERLSFQAERDWNLLRGELNTLASAYSVAWNWNNVPAAGGGVVAAGFDAMTTGTYRLNVSQSDDPRVTAERATRGLPSNVRQRINDSLVRRLEAPDVLAVERRGTSVTLASTRSPRATVTADGREHVENYPNGRTSRVRASLSGDVLTVVSNGDRANDFTVIIDPVDGGRRLLVTRSLYAERLNQPVTLRSYYDRVSDTAQLGLYVPAANTGTYNNTGAVSGNFVVPDGTRLVAVLDTGLSTRTTREGDRFRVTVRAPAQYDGAVIEGHVSGLDRSGRVTGRSEMTLNYDTIRLRDGRTFQFAGSTEGVRTAAGELVRVDNEGTAEGDNRTNDTITRTAIGTAIGAIIGAIAGGGDGAAVGAVVGAGAGAGSVYVQGSEDLTLPAGTEVTLRAGAPR
jgi:hypothetical protein